MKPKRNLLIGVTFVVTLSALLIGQRVLENRTVAEAAGVQAPTFEVDPLWPKPLPNHWILGNTIGVSADAQDHIWIIHRGGSLEAKEVYATTNPPGASCCLPAPPILEFDQAGNLLHHWGGSGEGYEWPESNHGIPSGQTSEWRQGESDAKKPNRPDHGLIRQIRQGIRAEVIREERPCQPSSDTP